MNPWLTKAYQAVDAYRDGIPLRNWPPPKSVGYCAQAARALFTAVTGKHLFAAQVDQDKDGDVDALDMLARFKLFPDRATVYVHQGPVKAWHQAAAKGAIGPGTFLFFSGDVKNGHVGVIVDVKASANPARSLLGYTVLENTTSHRHDGRRGTRLTPLTVLCGVEGSGRIVAVVKVKGT